jgi:hypothetical protein
MTTRRRPAADPTKRCPGVTDRIPAHEAPLTRFAKNRARKDGLSRVCRCCWAAYEVARKAAKVATAATAEA